MGYGSLSKGERNRIKNRVRAAMAAQAQTEGRFLGSLFRLSPASLRFRPNTPGRDGWLGSATTQLEGPRLGAVRGSVHAVLDRFGGELGPGADAEFGEDVHQVGLDCGP